MKNIGASFLWLAILSSTLSVPSYAQQTPETTAPPPIDQAVTCSVHDAWVLGGKTENGFFQIVEELAELSAQKRGLTLPDNEATGQQFGNYIKAQAKLDHDQLLYAVVDRAVKKYGVKAPAGQ
jgi:hypothetical protein